MKNYLHQLAEHAITSATLDQLAATMAERAKANGFSHPIAVYHSLAVDLALGALDNERESAESLGKTHSVKDWLAIISGCSNLP